ncbi:DUF1963 domain-containing protein [Nordella sp. HKS 07]|uniref:DUF1963 domain-containing protein n=1 Tax=Nordella sp. HKS 07 TaxID=2712222 RepID=UPI0013E17B3F|nr:DUF1963 domain-containing protein [Nordella sp. HKS 07]QIG47504.1 DUF1963 domain-containing protein [Nordella sp. HKS 07]
MKNLLARFLNHNIEMLAKAPDNAASHYDNEVWLRAVVPARPITTEIGWVGGNPALPAPFHWPSRGGQPYQFLCQINCASLPSALWGGLGPRTGWLAFFMASSGQIDAKVIYAAQLGPERRNEDAWRKSATGLHWVDGKYDALLGAPPRWGLDFVYPADGRSGVPDRLRRRPHADDTFSVAATGHRPVSWETFDLLLEEALSQSKKSTAHLDDLARQQNASLKPPHPDMMAALKEMIETADRLSDALKASETPQPFSLQSWLSHAGLIFRLRELDDEVSLQRGESFLTVVRKADIALANGQGTLAGRLQTPHFSADSAQGRRHADLMQLVCNVERDLNKDPMVPPHGPGASDVAAWLAYREKYSREWAAYAGRVRHIRKLYYAFWADNAETIVPRTKRSLMAPPPDTLEKALARADSSRQWAVDRLTSLENGGPDAQQKLSDYQRRRTEAEMLITQLEGVRQRGHQRRREAAFDPDEWTASYRLLDEKEARQVLPRYWSTTYRILRSEAAKRLYASDPDSLSLAVRQALEAEWAFDAEQGTLQIGGTPRGWCVTYIENKPDSVVLLQFPTNNLTHFTCGDVSDLVVSISRTDLERQNFAAARVDISN